MIFSQKIKYLFFILFFFTFLKLNAEDNLLKNISNLESQIIVESNNQRSDLNNSIFYAEGDVLITNTDEDFIAKSNKAIIYKLTGKIKLMKNTKKQKEKANKDFFPLSLILLIGLKPLPG